MSERAAAILIEGDKLLLIHRRKDGGEYHVLPGGSIESGETPEAACVREVEEETNLQVEIQKKIAILKNKDRIEHYFQVVFRSGNIQLGGPEKERNSSQNSYTLRWVKVSDLDTILLLPKSIVPIVNSL